MSDENPFWFPFPLALVYLGFFALIGFAVWWTKSAYCLWGLVLIPSMHYKK